MHQINNIVKHKLYSNLFGSGKIIEIDEKKKEIKVQCENKPPFWYNGGYNPCWTYFDKVEAIKDEDNNDNEFFDENFDYYEIYKNYNVCNCYIYKVNFSPFSLLSYLITVDLAPYIVYGAGKSMLETVKDFNNKFKQFLQKNKDKIKLAKYTNYLGKEYYKIVEITK